METLGIFIFFGCALICLTLFGLRERKAEKRIWEWRERLLESINNNTSGLDDIVKALMYEK